MKIGTEQREDTVLELVALSGDFPVSLLGKIPGSMEWTRKAVRKLREQKLVRIYDNSGMKSLRLTMKGRRLLHEVSPLRFPSLLQPKEVERGRISRAEDRSRLHNIAAAELFALRLGCSVFEDEKIPLSCLGAGPMQNAFYSSVEVKSLFSEYMKIRASKATGLLTATSGRAWLLYPFGTLLPRWSGQQEVKMKGVCEQVVKAEPDAIALAQSPSLLLDCLKSTGGPNHQYFTLKDGRFPSFYFVPDTEKGLEQARLLLDAEKRNAFEEELLRNIPKYADAQKSPFPTDAVVGKRHILFAWDLDMPRLFYFKKGLAYYDRKGAVLCFPWQAEMLGSFFEPDTDIRFI